MSIGAYSILAVEQMSRLCLRHAGETVTPLLARAMMVAAVYWWHAGGRAWWSRQGVRVCVRVGMHDGRQWACVMVALSMRVGVHDGRDGRQWVYMMVASGRA